MFEDDDKEEEDRGIGILDVKAHLEKVFPGVKVNCPPTIGNSFQAEFEFFEYEVRVILSGRRVKDRTIHYRFMQRVEQPGTRKPTKRLIQDETVTSAEEFVAEVTKTKAYLMGVIFAIHKAFKPPHTPRINSIDDLFKGD